MAQGLLALGGFCCEQTFCGTAKRLVARNSFQKSFVAIFAKVWKKNSFLVFLCDLAKILQTLSCFGHFALKSAQALNMEVFVAFGGASFRWVPVRSGGFW